MLVVHYSHDQPDHAVRLTRLGIARRLPRERYNASTAVQQIQALLQDPNYAVRAADIGTRISKEKGVATASDLLQDLLKQSRPGAPGYAA